MRRKGEEESFGFVSNLSPLPLSLSLYLYLVEGCLQCFMQIVGEIREEVLLPIFLSRENHFSLPHDGLKVLF